MGKICLYIQGDATKMLQTISVEIIAGRNEQWHNLACQRYVHKLILSIPLFHSH